MPLPISGKLVQLYPNPNGDSRIKKLDIFNTDTEAFLALNPWGVGGSTKAVERLLSEANPMTGVFQNIDPPPSPLPPGVSVPPAFGAGGGHTR
jgi:hypothetical protein